MHTPKEAKNEDKNHKVLFNKEEMSQHVLVATLQATITKQWFSSMKKVQKGEKTCI